MTWVEPPTYVDSDPVRAKVLNDALVANQILLRTAVGFRESLGPAGLSITGRAQHIESDSGTATGGTFTLSYPGGATSGAIPWNVTAAELGPIVLGILPPRPVPQQYRHVDVTGTSLNAGFDVVINAFLIGPTATLQQLVPDDSQLVGDTITVTLVSPSDPQYPVPVTIYDPALDYAVGVSGHEGLGSFPGAWWLHAKVRWTGTTGDAIAAIRVNDVEVVRDTGIVGSNRQDADLEWEGEVPPNATVGLYVTTDDPPYGSTASDTFLEGSYRGEVVT